MRQAVAEADQPAGVIPAAPWRVKALSIMPDYRLAVTFKDGTSGIADLSALTTAANCGIYGALKDPTVFGQARLELGVVTWPNEADIDPAWMYEQFKYTKTLASPGSAIGWYRLVAVLGDATSFGQVGVRSGRSETSRKITGTSASELVAIREARRRLKCQAMTETVLSQQRLAGRDGLYPSGSGR